MQAVVWLQANLLPKGVLAIAVQRVSWIHAIIDCGPAGIVAVHDSKTDVVFVLQEAGSMLPAANQKLTEDLLQSLLPYTIGFYEVRLQRRDLVVGRFMFCRCGMLLR